MPSPIHPNDRPSWRQSAACQGIDTEAFFMPDTEGLTRSEAASVGQEYTKTLRQVRRMCASCPVRRACRLASLAEEAGMWAGVTETTRRRVLRQYRAAGWEADDLLDACRRALYAMDAGTPWRVALEEEGIADHPFFHDYARFAPPFTTIDQLNQAKADAA